MVLLICIIDQVSHVLLVVEDLLVLDVQLIETVENRLKHKGTHGSRSGSRSSVRWAHAGIDRSARPSTVTLRDVLDIIITTIITTPIRVAPKLTIHIIIINQVRRVGDGGLGSIGKRKKGTTVVIEPYLTATECFKKLHVNARDKINAARLAGRSKWKLGRHSPKPLPRL